MRGFTPQDSFSIGNSINASDLVDACQSHRHISCKILLYKPIELLNGLLKPQSISIAIQIVSNRRYFLGNSTMINIPFYDFNHAVHHKFFRHLASIIKILCVILVHPYFNNSFLVDAYILLLNSEKTHLFGQILEPLQALSKDMQEIGKGYMLNIRQSDGYLLEVQFLDMTRRAQLILRFVDKVTTSYEVRMILSEQIHLSLLFMLFIIRRIDGVFLDPLGWVPATSPDLQQLEGVNELPILGLEGLSTGIALIVSHYSCYYFEYTIKIIISYTLEIINQPSFYLMLIRTEYYYQTDNKLNAVSMLNNNFYPQNCMQHKQPLFSFSLRIEKQMARLNIYEDDNLEDVLERFGKLTKVKQNFKGRIKERLENQLKRFVCERECSDRVREKIQAFLEESKVVIVAISQTEHFEEPAKQNLQKVEQLSCRHEKKNEKDEIKLSLPVSHDVSPVLTKYFSKEILVEQPQEEKSSEEIIYKAANRHKDSKSYDKLNQHAHHSHRNRNSNTSEFNIRKGNQTLTDIDKIIKNRIARSQQRQLRADIAKNIHQRKLSVTLAQDKYDQPKLASYESYQSYKLSKRDHNITKYPSKQCLNPSNTQSKEYLQPSKNVNIIRNQHINSTLTKFDYDRCLQAKGVLQGEQEISIHKLKP